MLNASPDHFPYKSIGSFFHFWELRMRCGNLVDRAICFYTRVIDHNTFSSAGSWISGITCSPKILVTKLFAFQQCNNFNNALGLKLGWHQILVVIFGFSASLWIGVEGWEGSLRLRTDPSWLDRASTPASDTPETSRRPTPQDINSQCQCRLWILRSFAVA